MSRNGGFTLIEIVATLVLVGIIGVVLSMFLVQGVQNYFVSEQAADLTQQAQTALSRISLELENLVAVDSANSDTQSIQYTVRGYSQTASDDNRNLYLSGDELKLGPGGSESLLIDGVDAGTFALGYYESDGTAWVLGSSLLNLYRIHVAFDLQGSAFETDVYMRRTGRFNGPHEWNADR